MPRPPRMRPRFEVIVPHHPDEVLTRIREEIETSTCPCTGKIVGKHVHLRIGEKYRHYWSPHLWVDVHNHEEGSLVRGLFGPHPSVWSMFMAIYAILGFVAVVALIFGYSQYTIDQVPTALWVLPITAVLAVGAYFFSLYGQGLSLEQMYVLRALVDRSTTDAEA